MAAIDAFEAGNVSRARDVQVSVIAPLFQQCLDHGFAPVAKAGLVARGILPDDAVRPPLVGLDAEARAAVEASVETAESLLE